MLLFKTIIAILAFLSMNFLAYQIDKNYEKDQVFVSLCVGGIACCGVILGLMLGLMLGLIFG